MTSDRKRKLTKKHRRAMFIRSLTMEFSWNYERQQNMGFCFAMLPAVKALYDRKEQQTEAAKRHMEYFNTTPYVSTAILGIAAAMEEENAGDEAYDVSSINRVKTALMGPLAGIGDSMLWGTLRVLATGIGVSLAMKGSLLGPILFWIIFNIPAFVIRYLCLKEGYERKTEFLDRLLKSGIMPGLALGTTVVSLMVTGAMIPQMITILPEFTWNRGGTAVALQDVLDQIMPGLLPLLMTLGIYRFLQRRGKVWHVLAMLAVLGVAGRFFGIFTPH